MKTAHLPITIAICGCMLLLAVSACSKNGEALAEKEWEKKILKDSSRVLDTEALSVLAESQKIPSGQYILDIRIFPKPGRNFAGNIYETALLSFLPGEGLRISPNPASFFLTQNSNCLHRKIVITGETNKVGAKLKTSLYHKQEKVSYSESFTIKLD